MTLQGVIYKPDGTAYTGSFQVRIVTAPAGGNSNTIVGLPLTVECDAEATPTGQYSTTLISGVYYVDIPSVPRFQIEAPLGSSTAALEDISVEDSFANPGAPYDSWEDVNDTTVRDVVQFLWVREDLNGDKARFWRALTTPTGLEGVDFVRDAAGTYFERET